MTDEQETPQDAAPEAAPEPAAAVPTPEAPAVEAAPAAPTAADATPAPAPAGDVAAGKTFAILSYALNFLGLPFFALPLITRDNDFALYHAKQSMIIWLLGIVSGVISSILAVTVVLACVSLILIPVVGIFALVINIMGLINATKEETKPVPLIGKLAEKWFAGITKAA